MECAFFLLVNNMPKTFRDEKRTRKKQKRSDDNTVLVWENGGVTHSIVKIASHAYQYRTQSTTLYTVTASMPLWWVFAYLYHNGCRDPVSPKYEAFLEDIFVYVSIVQAATIADVSDSLFKDALALVNILANGNAKIHPSMYRDVITGDDTSDHPDHAFHTQNVQDFVTEDFALCFETDKLH